jgi:parallel beta-helix repeat protein
MDGSSVAGGGRGGVAGLGAGSVVAVQASASGSGSSASVAPTAPKAPPRPAGAAAKIAPAVIATNAHCGQTLTASVTLNGDLVCPGAGLIIAKASVVLNLNGHTITGPGAFYINYGVQISGTSDTVENGVITGFYHGVNASGTTDTILNMRINHSSYGVVDYGSGLKVTTSTIALTTYDGVYAAGVGATYSGDHELNNGIGSGYSGLVIHGAKTLVTGNVANGNRQYGILDAGTGTTLTKNTASFNGWDGIFVQGDVTVVDGAGNIAKGNDYVSGNPPVQCEGVVCT